VWIEGAWRNVPVFDRQALPATPRKGPALVLDYGSTTLVPFAWSYQIDRANNLLLHRR